MSIAVIEGSAIPSIAANRYPIVDILSFISVEIAFNRLSNVPLLGILSGHRLVLVYGYIDSLISEKYVIPCLNQF